MQTLHSEPQTLNLDRKEGATCYVGHFAQNVGSIPRDTESSSTVPGTGFSFDDSSLRVLG
jgi:hypothetical protein